MVTGRAPDALDALFASAMAQLGPFEPKPSLAVAVSGGADSLTLALLADRWARAHGGRVTALTVDHGLRSEAAAEARQVGRWLKAAKIRHVILRWNPPVPPKKQVMGARLANLQSAARDARYELLTDWCREQAVLHLLLAHHRDDQAETLLLRLARGSGLEGLAAMAPLAERASVRLLRPLLGMGKEDLTAYLEARGQPWIEDPSNRDSANARVRMRKLLPRLAEEGMSAARLAETAARLAQARAALEGATNRFLADAVAIYPEGYLRLDAGLLRLAEREIGLRALARAVACIGGQTYGPRMERLSRLYDRLCAAGEGPGLGRGRTLGGCRILPARRIDGDPERHVLVVREPSVAAPPLPWRVGDAVSWDGRFRISGRVPNSQPMVRKTKRLHKTREYTFGALSEQGLRDISQATGGRLSRRLPHDVLVTLPTFRWRNIIWAVPHLDYWRDSADLQSRQSLWQVLFAPILPLSRPGFTLV